MTILAFLQNMWVRDVARTEALFKRYPEHRERYLRYALFAGCVTGRRLKAAFGEELCDQIIWEEASPVVTGRSSEAPPPDKEHIRATIAKHQPGLVICLTAPARAVVGKLATCPIIYGPHPAARFPDIMDRLQAVAAEVRVLTAASAKGLPPHQQSA